MLIGHANISSSKNRLMALLNRPRRFIWRQLSFQLFLQPYRLRRWSEEVAGAENTSKNCWRSPKSGRGSKKGKVIQECRDKNVDLEIDTGTKVLTDKISHVVKIIDAVNGHLPIVDSLVVAILMTLDDESITSEKWPVADLTNVFFVGSKISIAKASMKKVERKQSNETKL